MSDDTSKDYNYMRQDNGGMVTQHNGVADKLLQNDKLFNALKGNWNRSDWNGSHNIKTTTGREDGKFYIKREQINSDVIAEDCAAYRRAAEMGINDPLAPIGEDGKLTYRWMSLPKVVGVRISDTYFGGIPFSMMKQEKTLKAQYYMVVEREYPQYVCYPGGKLPIPNRDKIPYPTAMGQQRFFKGI